MFLGQNLSKLGRSMLVVLHLSSTIPTVAYPKFIVRFLIHLVSEFTVLLPLYSMVRNSKLIFMLQVMSNVSAEAKKTTVLIASTIHIMVYEYISSQSSSLVAREVFPL